MRGRNDQACYEGQRSPFWYWTDLIVGLFFLVISVMWLVHMIVFMAFDPYLGLFLNALFAGLDSFFPLFGTIAYCIFVFYLLWAVMKGTFKVGMRVAFFTLYPMEYVTFVSARACDFVQFRCSGCCVAAGALPGSFGCGVPL